MARWLGILLAIGLASTSADAQVFKPKTKKTTTSEKKSSSSKSSSSEKVEKTEKAEKSEKKSARTSPSKKRVTTKPKKKHAQDGDEASDDAPKESDKDFVKITDDDDVE